ncbi:MAG: type II toxin-antitoxin system VapC family toxin [Opitutaceae bacterium]
MDLIADTTLLVGLWRGQKWAAAFASANAGRSLGIPWVVMGEFWHGSLRAGHDPEKVREFLSIGIPIHDAQPAVPCYARICAALQTTKAWKEIGQNDLWIAATALAESKPLVTRNRRHFHRIDGLQLEVVGE